MFECKLCFYWIISMQSVNIAICFTWNFVADWDESEVCRLEAFKQWEQKILFLDFLSLYTFWHLNSSHNKCGDEFLCFKKCKFLKSLWTLAHHIKKVAECQNRAPCKQKLAKLGLQATEAPMMSNYGKHNTLNYRWVYYIYYLG